MTGHEGGAFKNGMSVLRIRDTRVSSSVCCPSCEDTRQREDAEPGSEPSADTEAAGTSVLDFPANYEK